MDVIHSIQLKRVDGSGTSVAPVFVRSFAAIVSAESGVSDPDHVLSGLMRMPSATYAAPEIRQRYLARFALHRQTLG